MKIKLRAASRLNIKEHKVAADTDWFSSLTNSQQHQYLEDHPHSRMKLSEHDEHLLHLLDDDDALEDDGSIDKYLDSLAPEEQEQLLSKVRR